MFIKGIAIFLSSCRNVGAELIISKRATQSYFWVTLIRSSITIKESTHTLDDYTE